MYNEILEEIGLSPNEAKIYETLLSTGEAAVSTISLRAGVHRRNVYDTLNRLIEKGLVFRIFQKGEHRFQPVNPDKLLEIVNEKTTRLSAVIPDLQILYTQDPITEAAYIYKGIEGYKNYRQDLLRVSEETFFLGAKGLWYSPQLGGERQFDVLGGFQSGDVPHKILFDSRVPAELPQAIENVDGEYKVLPAGYETSGVVDIFGDYVVTFADVEVGNVGEDVTIFVMRNKQLADSYKTWFSMIWDLLP